MHRVTSPCLKRRLGLTNASRWTRQVQLEAGTLAAFLGLGTNEESSFASKKKRGTLSERLRNSQEALTRQESKVTSLIDTLKTVAADSRPISEQSSNSSQYLSKRAKRKKRKADAPPAEQPSDFSQPTSSPSSPYDETATIKGERWKDDWGTDRLAPRQPDQPDVLHAWDEDALWRCQRYLRRLIMHYIAHTILNLNFIVHFNLFNLNSNFKLQARLKGEVAFEYSI
ncbi:hypothetical protein ONZ45_g11327 [Pleurotus djamor]|nr:hypothetical protein ONZ45_g11327 [Pleurotus djamor]